MPVEQLLYDLHGALDLVWRRIVGDRNVHQAPDVWASADVFDGARDHPLVRDRHQVSGERAYLGRAKAHLLDRAVVAVDDYPLADAERLVDQYHDRAEEVLDRILRRERESQTSEPKPGDDRAHRLARYALGYIEPDDEDDDHSDRLAQERDKHVIERAVRLLGGLGCLA